MGVNIDLHVYDKVKLARDIDEFVLENGGYREDALNAYAFLEIVAPHFGILTDHEFLVVWNEYYDDYNPASQFLSAVHEYYFPEIDLDGTFWSDAYKTASEGANASEVLSDVFPSEFGWEGKFS